MVCLDTSFVIDFLNKGEGKEILESFEQKGEEIKIPAPVITELTKGLYSKHSSKQEKEKINEFIESMSTLDLDKESSLVSGKIESDLREKGEPIEILDVLIASITISNNETLITNNEKHFSRIEDLSLRPL